MLKPAHKKIFIDFMALKNEILMEMQPLPLYDTPLDYYLEDFPDNALELFKKNIFEPISDSDICPSCAVHEIRCVACNYQKKHGACDGGYYDDDGYNNSSHPDNRYIRIRRNIGGGQLGTKIKEHHEGKRLLELIRNAS